MKTGRVEDGGPESGKRVDGGTEKRELPLPWAPRSGNHWEGIGGRIKRERRVSKKRGSMIGVGSDRNREDEGKAAHQTRQLPLAPLFIHPRTSHFPVSPESFSPFPHRPSVCPTLLSYLSHPIIPSVVPVLHFVRYISWLILPLSLFEGARAISLRQVNFLRRNLRVYFNTRIFFWQYLEIKD